MLECWGSLRVSRKNPNTPTYCKTQKCSGNSPNSCDNLKKLVFPHKRLNVSLLDNDTIKTNFLIIWSYLLERKEMFPNLIQWWDELAKPQIKKFYIHQGKEQKQLRQGLLKYFENNLRMLYDNANNDNIIDFDMMNSLKNKIDSYKEKEVEGIRIRCRIQDNVHCERISKYLIAKQKEIAQKKIITKMIDDKGTLLTSNVAIQKHAIKFYHNLYSKTTCDIEKQLFFLSFLQNELSDVF